MFSPQSATTALELGFYRVGGIPMLTYEIDKIDKYLFIEMTDVWAPRVWQIVVNDPCPNVFNFHAKRESKKILKFSYLTLAAHFPIGLRFASWISDFLPKLFSCLKYKQFFAFTSYVLLVHYNTLLPILTINLLYNLTLVAALAGINLISRYKHFSILYYLWNIQYNIDLF